MAAQQATHGDRSRITVLGLGQMGRALAEALLSAGYRTTVWNRTTGKADTLVGKGALRADTVSDAIAASPLVIVCVGDYDGVHEVLDGSVAEIRGRTLVNLTTGTPDEVQAVAAWAAGHGADYLDGAMMAVPQTVASPDAFFLYSGSAAAFETHRDVLDVLATSYYLGTDAAAAELWDLALLSSGYAALTGFLHGAALLDTADVAPSAFLPLATRWLHGMIAFMSELADEAESRDYTTGVSPVAMNQVAVAKLAHVSQSRGVSTDIHAPLQALLGQRVADGHGTDSFASVFELLRKRS
ncbi:NAD(P)-binding domain-containing protein [Micromonospora sp. NPDC049374]|uniref:NAD(P)-dependent oxidoreductase n=1 Tax=Micromonospora sp. NPDC049374 TaxID=3154352 RepID=UPI0034413013